VVETRTQKNNILQEKLCDRTVSIPYSVFDKDQRVTHAAITENKHLSAVLEYIKAEQDKAPPKKRRATRWKAKHALPANRKAQRWLELKARTKG